MYTLVLLKGIQISLKTTKKIHHNKKKNKYDKLTGYYHFSTFSMSDCLFYENSCRVRNACKSLPDSGIHAVKKFSVWLWRQTPIPKLQTKYWTFLSKKLVSRDRKCPNVGSATDCSVRNDSLFRSLKAAIKSILSIEICFNIC